MTIDKDSEEKLETQVIKLSIILVISVFFIKIINAFFTNSLGFYTELTDSITDFILVAITFFALKKSRRPADVDHMFGHSKINSFAGIFESVVTFVIYGIISYEAILTLIDISRYTIRDPQYTAITLSVVVVINFFISGKILKIARKTNNPTIKAQSVNFRGDFFRNIAIIVGLIIASFGIYYFDPILALIFSIRSIYQSISVLRQGYNELMDYNAIDPDIIQNLRQSINDIDGISNVDDFAVRSEGNSLYFNLKISLEKFESLYSIKGINELIKTKIKEIFEEYNCNTQIQIMSQKPERKYEDLFDEIKLIVLKSDKVDEVHDISLDFLENEILIQFHMLVNPLLKLSAAHEIATDIEEKIAQKLSEKITDQKIQVISHIEPADVKERIHSHNLPDEIPDSYKETIKEILNQIPQLKDCNNINLLQEEDGVYLTVKITFKEDVNVQEAHWIAEKLEFNLKAAIPNLKRCIIHPEFEFLNSSYENDLVSKKKLGIYYTPEFITDYICRNTIIPTLSEQNATDIGQLIIEFRNKPQILIEKINNLKILDPSCGDGAFLTKSIEILLEILEKLDTLVDNEQILNLTGVNRENFAENILKNNIFGVDIDPNSVKSAIDSLIEKNISPDLKSSLNSSLSNNIICRDALFDKNNPSFNDFDVIIGNPPYVDIKDLDSDTVKLLFSKYSCVENRVNLYAAFIELSLKNLLRNGGYLGFIVPNSLLYNSTYKKIRKLILDNTIVQTVVRLPDRIFDSAHVETVIIILRKEKNNKDIITPSYIKLNFAVNQQNNITALIYPRDLIIKNINMVNCKDIRKIDQANWYEKPFYRFRLIDEKIYNILKKIEKNSVSLGGNAGICDFSLGITPYDKYKGHTKTQIENKVFHANKKLDDTYKPLLSGSDITRYGVFWNKHKFIKYGKWLGASRESRFFTEPHIIVRQIISGNPPRIYAAYTEDELYNTQIGFNIIIKPSQSFSFKPNYILAILNSKLMAFYHKQKFLDETKHVFQKILIENAKNFPIKLSDDDVQRKLSELTDNLRFIVKKIHNFQNNGDLKFSNNANLNSLKSKFEKIDEKIDKMIYTIYHLSSDEIIFIENSSKKS